MSEVSPAKNKKENKNKVRFGRRSFFVGGTLGVLAAPLIDRILFRTNKEKLIPLEKISSEKVLAAIQKYKKEFESDSKFKNRLDVKVLNDPHGRSRLEYVREAFLTTKSENFSPRMQAKLAVIIPGLAAQESKFDASSKNTRSGAYGIYQVTESHLNFINEIRKRRGEELFTHQTLNRMIESTNFIFYSLDKYFYKEVCVPAMEFAKSYGLSDEQAENFGIYCMLASYNNGPTRLLDVLNVFKKVYTPGVVGDYIFTPLSLFHVISVWAEKTKARSGYGVESSQYLFRVLAGAEYLGYEKLRDILPETGSSPLVQKPESANRDVSENLLQISGDYGRTGALGGAAAATAYIGQRLSSEEKIGRRQAIRNMAGLAAASAIVATGVETAVRNPGIFNGMNFSWWEKEEVGVVYKDGSIYSPKKVEKEFKKSFEMKLLKTKSLETRVGLPRRNYTEVVKKYLESELVTTKFPQLSEAELSRISKGADGKYGQVEEVNETWRLRGVGSGAASTHINNMKYAWVAKETTQLISDLTKKFQQETSTFLPKGWFIRPVINSLTRTKEKNVLVPGASQLSAHLNGLGFDISETRFDIGFESGGKKYFSEVSRVSENPQVVQDILKALNNAWAKILLDAHNNEKTSVGAIITYEPKANHYHITAKVKQ